MMEHCQLSGRRVRRRPNGILAEDRWIEPARLSIPQVFESGSQSCERSRDLVSRAFLRFPCESCHYGFISHELNIFDSSLRLSPSRSGEDYFAASWMRAGPIHKSPCGSTNWPSARQISLQTQMLDRCPMPAQFALRRQFLPTLSRISSVVRSEGRASSSRSQASVKPRSVKRRAAKEPSSRRWREADAPCPHVWLPDAPTLPLPYSGCVCTPR